MTNALAGFSIANTRPTRQAEPLNAMIREAGGSVINFPLLEIAPLKDYQTFDSKISTLHNFEMTLVVSVNAVDYALPRILKIIGDIPKNLVWLGMGPSSRKALMSFGVSNILTPQTRFDSEALLELPELQSVSGKKILILRGLGGRDLIASTLQARGATVTYGECYQRLNPQNNVAKLEELARQKQLHALVITSSEALRNLLDLTDNGRAPWLKTCSICTSHERIATLANESGLNAVTAKDIGDDAMLNCLIEVLSKSK